MGRTHDVIISGFDLNILESKLLQVTEQRDKLEDILKKCLYEMPVGYIPNHTVENLPDMIKEQVKMLVEETAYGEKLEKQLKEEREIADALAVELSSCYAPVSWMFNEDISKALKRWREARK